MTNFIYDIKQEYIDSFCNIEDDVLKDLYRETHLTQLHPRMISGPTQAAFIAMLVKISNAKNVLEIGTYTGYTSICIARALPENGKLTSIEINDEIEWLIRKYFKLADIENKVNLLIGDALEILPKIEEVFDLVFIDADKREYINYYEIVLSKTKPGGLILVDNVLWDNKIFYPVESNDYMTKGIMEFNDFVRNDNRVEKVILDIRDGFMILRKNGRVNRR
ncbi:MAG: O-methyltransferase [Bacteroidales bacterium]|jgi:predicted O-methyltransferase YrrM|nr:O-methyltransferase [Bacteroidales bacterium]HOL97504.1 O-methyltransferase [Bacteroidales bacterium]HOM35772.1 O-methyltransferase [Bacteroidales bacterium]HPD23010.1 O-methyltransferase [Bacteroidales bacterium]HRS98849.1 O-methyltransferase [Bacteroidales bacterium]